ncbi:hypothetical protein [Amycolatopsis sp. CA-230715]|uniref:hypothetical protein n=1 Tax=Amycolatopsis sp. CA-230715 TaxID=2745196 RepID=UPI001C02176B|nr:hypothetical protein [Amycolatopsis sp. CA-230715]QWF82488.1 hypothetical protein HUW46_05925 [Amycolatopsis sp. CA-230715]
MAVNEDGPLDHIAATSRISQLESKVGRTKKLYVTSVALLGVLTLGFFAVVGGVPRASVKPYDSLLFLFPIVAAFVVAGIQKASTSGHRVLRIEQLLLTGYILSCAAVIALDIFVLKQGTLAAALPGVVPAAICFAGAVVLGKR